MRKITLITLAAVVSLSSAARAQDIPTDPMLQRLEAIVGQSPTELLLEHRDELALDRAQVARLQVIADRLRNANQAVLDTHLTARKQPEPGAARQPDRQRPGSRERLSGFRMAMAEMRRNLSDARREALEVLTPEQRRRAQELDRR